MIDRLDNIRDGLSSAIATAATRIGTPAYTVADSAPDTERELLRCYAETGRLIVWAGGSDRTVFGSPADNYMFRAWHDYCHILSGMCRHVQCFQPIHEYAVADWQCGRIGDRLAKLVQIEVADQARYFAETGNFVADQIAFTLDRL